MSDREPDAAIVETPSPMRIPLFRAMWTASLISTLGAVMQTAGAYWMMASLTDSPQLIALGQSSTALPIVVLSCWAGAAIGRDHGCTTVTYSGLVCRVSLAQHDSY